MFYKSNSQAARLVFNKYYRDSFVSDIKSYIKRNKMFNVNESSFYDEVIDKSKYLAPSLNKTDNYKGSAGKVGVIGGSLEYTGAPYFAGISALRVGADLIHIFCAKEAALPIKSYSPELIVHPLLDAVHIDRIKEWMERLDVIIMGPGLGRDDKISILLVDLIDFWKIKKKPLILDADALFLLAQKKELLKHFQAPVILTPNKMELSRLLNTTPKEVDNVDVSLFIRNNEWGDFVTILSKGSDDHIYSSDKQLILKDLGGSGRRCGGQGDILSGALAVFINWSKHLPRDGSFVASYAACKLVRACNETGFRRKQRSMIATDMIEEIPLVFQKYFELPDVKC